LIREKETKVEKKRKRNGIRKGKRKNPLPSLGWAKSQPSSRAPHSLPAQAAQPARRSHPLTTGPRPSAPHLSLSRANLSRGQPDPTRQLLLPRPSLTGAIAAERPSPRRLAINARQPPRQTPPLCLSRPLTPGLPEPSQSALAPFLYPWRARRCSPSPLSPSLPRAPIKGPARAPSSPHNTSHPHCPPPRAVQTSAAVPPALLR
jgi:hypothetical protein